MNDLENLGINIIKKIIKNVQCQKQITFSRRELQILKLYFLLSGVRTHQLRNNILYKTGDSLFNAMIQDANDDPKIIQEKMIMCILLYWRAIKKASIGNHLKDIDSNDLVMHSCLLNIHNIMDSRLLIFKFESNNLLLTETLNFTEKNQLSNGTLLSFMPISVNVGIAFYFDPIALRVTAFTKQKSVIFQNDVLRARPKVKYVNFEIIVKKQIEYLKNSNNIINDTLSFTLNEAVKYYNKEDKYIYEVLNESKKTAILCNAMALVHCKNSYVIFQNQQDIKDAEKCIIEKRIFRIEDFQ